MRKYFPLALLLAATLLLAACNASRKMPDPQSAASDFLQKISESRFQEAYESTAFAFQAKTNFRSFQATAKDLGLSTGTISCKWLNDERNGNDIKLSGELMTTSGSVVPVRIKLIPERGAWRVFTLHTPSQGSNKEEDPFSLLGKGDAFNHSATHEVPSVKVLRKLAEKHLLLLSKATLQNDFTEFYDNVSKAWQNQLTLNQLKAAFQPFVVAKVDLRGIIGLEPVFDVTPEVNSEGILLLAGHYPTTPNPTTFRLQFIYEFPYWKLLGINVQIKD